MKNFLFFVLIVFVFASYQSSHAQFLDKIKKKTEQKIKKEGEKKSRRKNQQRG